MSEVRDNEQQIQYWNEQGGPKWARYQAVMDRQLAPIAAAMFERANPGPGHATLDLGCGCGATTIELARRVTPAGHATGVDISRPMLAVARARAAEEGLDNIEFLQADLQVHAMGGSDFDLAVSRFGVMFFSDPASAFRNIRRGLRAGGRMAFVCWRPLRENPWAALPMMEAARYVKLPPPPAPEEPGPFAFGDASRVERILSEAGFAGIELEPLDLPMQLGATSDLQSAVDLTFEIGPLSRLLVDAEPEIREKVREAVHSALSRYHTPSGVALPSAVWIVTARNP